MHETLVLNQITATYEGYSSTLHQRISITPEAMTAAGRIGLRRAETNIHFFAQIMSVDFWLHDPTLLVLPGVIVTAMPSA